MSKTELDTERNATSSHCIPHYRGQAPFTAPLDMTAWNLLVARAQQWAIDREFLQGATHIGQTMKLLEELGEFVANYNRGKDCKDDLGDMLVVCAVLQLLERGKPALLMADIVPTETCNVYTAESRLELMLYYIQQMLAGKRADGSPANPDAVSTLTVELARSLGYNPVDCLWHAYNEIKDRTGRMMNGKFVKSADMAINQL